jgi:hypothetical protein
MESPRREQVGGKVGVLGFDKKLSLLRRGTDLVVPDSIIRTANTFRYALRLKFKHSFVKKNCQTKYGSYLGPCQIVKRSKSLELTEKSKTRGLLKAPPHFCPDKNLF